MKCKAIIVDDERLARAEMRRLLADVDEISVVGDAEDLNEALALIKSEKPQLVFLDIQLSNESGFDLIEQISPDIKVIFVTAFDEFALRAFEVNALDYLLKPVNPDRLAAALKRLKTAASADKKTLRLFEFDDRIFLDLGERSVFLKVSDISHIAASGDYSEVFTVDKRKLLIEKPLREWEERLPEKHFVRIHRQTIINLEQIRDIETWFNRSFQVHLKTAAEPLSVSRRYATKLRERFA